MIWIEYYEFDRTQWVGPMNYDKYREYLRNQDDRNILTRWRIAFVKIKLFSSEKL